MTALEIVYVAQMIVNGFLHVCPSCQPWQVLTGVHSNRQCAMLATNTKTHQRKEEKNYFNKTSHQKGTFQGNKKRFAIYLSFVTLVTCVPVLGAEQFQFPCRFVFNSFCSNWFKLVIAYPQNSQTFRQKI